MKVLLIEDDKIDRMAFKRLVRSEDLPYEYTLAKSIQEATQALEKEVYDIIISDYSLGDGTAFEILEQEKVIPVIVVTGMGDEELAVTAIKKGAYDYLIKDDERKYLRMLPVTVNKALQQMQAEKEKKKMQEELVQAQKLDAIGKLAGGIAHDFNNLLTVITGHVELIMMDYQSCSNYYNDLKQVQSAAEHAANLVQQLLLFSQKKKMQFSMLNLNYVIQNFLTFLRRVIRPDIEIDIRLDKELWDLKADKANIEQVLMNMVLNAKDAMPTGGNILIETLNIDGSQHLLEDKEGSFVCLRISDTGQGMKQEVMDQIFEPFFTTKTPGSGNGLGLSVVYGIMKEHNGWIDVTSKPHEGTVFKLYFPASPQKNRSFQKPDFIVDSLKGRGENLLIIEDEDRLREVIKKVLMINGYKVLAAADATQAMDYIDNSDTPLHLVFSDVILPDTNGIELAKKILEKYPALKIIFTSGYFDRELMKLHFQEKTFPFLQKPYSIPNLLQVIRDTIEDKQVMAS